MVSCSVNFVEECRKIASLFINLITTRVHVSLGLIRVESRMPKYLHNALCKSKLGREMPEILDKQLTEVVL